MPLSRREAYLLDRLLAERDRRKGPVSLYWFLREAWHIIEPHSPFIPGYHLEAIAEHLEAVQAGHIKQLLINIPPRHAKSTIVSVAFPAWVWLKWPSHKFIYASHAYSLSKRDSIKCRSLIQSEWYRKTFKIKWSLAEDQNEKIKFENTEKGSRLATSVGGAVIGEGGDSLVIDDPLSPTDANSENMLEKVTTWYDQEFSTRINDPKTASKIVIMQRISERDLSQHLLDQGGWDHLCLPAEFEAKTTRMTSIGWEDPRKEEGEALWPARFGTEELKSLKRTLGAMGSAGQLQQRPSPMEGNIIKRSWWRFYDVMPEFDSYCQAWDLSFTGGPNSDFVVGTVWAKKGADKYLLDMVRARMTFTETLKAFENTALKWPKVNAKIVEKAANGAALIDTLQKKIPGIIAVSPSGSKLARAQSVAPQIESGNIYLPNPLTNPWVQDLLEEWAVFPNGHHDDIVDSCCYAIERLSTGLNFDWQPVSLTGTSKWL